MAADIVWGRKGRGRGIKETKLRGETFKFYQYILSVVVAKNPFYLAKIGNRENSYITVGFEQ